MNGALPFDRVLFFGKTKPHTRCTGNLVQALRETGRQVRWLSETRLVRWLGARQAERRIRRVLDGFRPGLVFVFFRDLSPPLLAAAAARAPVVTWMEEFVEPIPEELKARMAWTSLLALSNPVQLEEYRAAGAGRAEFVMSAAGASHLGQPLRRRRGEGPDVVFLGGPGRSPRRAELLARLSAHFRVAIYGKKWDKVERQLPRVRFHPPVGPREFARVCQEAGIVLGLNETHELPLYFSNRIWLTLACAGFHLTHYVPRMEGVFQAGIHLDWFHGDEECLEKVGSYLGRREERLRIGGQGRDLVRERHTYGHRVGQILAYLAEGL